MQEYTKYFKNQIGFERFIKELYKKYESTGKITGTLKLTQITNEEKEAFSKLFGEDLKEKEDLVISIKKFNKIMENSKYSSFDMATLIQEYLDIPLITKKEKKTIKKTQEDTFFNTILKESKEENVEWLREVIEKKNSFYMFLHKQYQKDKQALKKELENLVELIHHLPQMPTLLSIFASNYTKDPHYLDLENNHSTYFLYALAHISHIPFPNTREDKIGLLAKYHIEVDNLSNFVITYRLLSDKNYINEFGSHRETLILNIQNIMNSAYFDSPSKKVFIFENPSILSEILRRNISCSVVIAGGFPNSSVYLLLDKLVEKGNHLFYNGDFDPEGLLIACRLKEKYKDQLTLFCYQKEDYDECISNEVIRDSRIKKIENMGTQELQTVQKMIQIHKKAAYQENNKERLLDFVLEKEQK